MRIANSHDVEQVRNGEFVPNVVFTANYGRTKFWMRNFVQGKDTSEVLTKDQAMCESENGDLFIMHRQNFGFHADECCVNPIK